MSEDPEDDNDAKVAETVEHYLGHRNGGDMPSLIAYEQLKVLWHIRSLLMMLIIDDDESDEQSH